MKTKLNCIKSIALAIGVIALTTLGQGFALAQTSNNVPVLPSFNLGPLSLDALTNLPTATNYASTVLSVNAGIATKNGSVANALKLDLYVNTNWMFSAEIQNAAVGSVIQNATIFAGYRLKIWQNAQLDAQLLARDTWTTDASGDKPNFQGGVSIGCTWDLMTGGKIKARIENRVLSNPRGFIKGGPEDETVVFATMNF